MMSEIKQDLKYTKTHEWIKDNVDGTYTLGITDYAQFLLGDLVFVELPEVGATFKYGEDLCILESVKAASSVYAPGDLKVIAVNKNIEDKPETINQDCFASGWLIQFETDAMEKLITAKEYEAFATES